MTKAIVLVPHLNGIEEPCERGLKQLENFGIKIHRRRGCSGIDRARNEMVSNALHDGYDSIFFIDADISFDCQDALKLIARPEPVISGVYGIKGSRQFASQFADGIKKVVFGQTAPDTYPLKYAATGFLRIQATLLRQMIEFFKFPLCDTAWGRGCWPFFQPMIVPLGDGFRYLGEDYAFSERCRQMGVTPLADTKIRLSHWGYYGYTWDDTSESRQKHKTYNYDI